MRRKEVGGLDWAGQIPSYRRLMAEKQSNSFLLVVHKAAGVQRSTVQCSVGRRYENDQTSESKKTWSSRLGGSKSRPRRRPTGVGTSPPTQPQQHSRRHVGAGAAAGKRRSGPPGLAELLALILSGFSPSRRPSGTASITTTTRTPPFWRRGCLPKVSGR